MEQNKEPRNKAVHLQPNDLCKVDKNKQWEKTPYSINSAEIHG